MVIPKYSLPREFEDLNVRFFEIEPSGALKSGGLIALDGVHPTTCGYSLIAHEFIQVMRGAKPLKSTTLILQKSADGILWYLTPRSP